MGTARTLVRLPGAVHPSVARGGIPGVAVPTRIPSVDAHRQFPAAEHGSNIG